jgi:PiT family inorganic phosphate transporter
MSVIASLPPQALLILGLALAFAFLNGLLDSPNVVATVIASHSMTAGTALWLTALANAVGPFLFGVAVASSIGSVVAASAITLPVIEAALLASVGWSVVSWRLNIPSSSSHALIGGLAGAAVAAQGISAIQAGGFASVLIALAISSPIGLAAGYVALRTVRDTAEIFELHPNVNEIFRRGQWLTATWLALSHGANDGQKTMGLIVMMLIAAKSLTTFTVPLWVVAVSAGAIGLGTLFGSQGLIKTLGRGLYIVRPIHSFSTQIASGAVILGAALLGGPVSTTHVIGSAIMGAGSAERMNMVRWGLTRRILVAWLLTIPISGLLGGLIYLYVPGVR